MTLAVVALLAVTYGRILKEGSEYFVLFETGPTTRIDALNFCRDRNDGKLPLLENNGRIRQNAIHQLLQLHARIREAYVWTDDPCIPSECPPVNSDSWLFNNYETHYEVPDGFGYLAIGQKSNRLRKFVPASTEPSVIVCVYDLNVLRNKCTDGSIDDEYFECLDAGFCAKRKDNNRRFCLCDALYAGDDCLDNTSPCSVEPCQNSAICEADSSAIAGYRCRCLGGFTGVNCETNVDDCSFHEDQCNGAPCVDRVQSFFCDCAVAGGTGSTCEQPLEHCDSAPCMNGGTCVDAATQGYRCRCADGFEGNNCQTDIDECESSPCHGGQCTTSIAAPGEYRCVCLANRTGVNCETVYDPCNPNPCSNMARCVYTNMGRFFTCDCAGTGFKDRFCHRPLDECAEDVTFCRPNGQCMDLPNGGGVMCNCNAGSLPPRCDRILDGCGADVTLCRPNGQCVDLPNGGHECMCSAGYVYVPPRSCNPIPTTKRVTLPPPPPPTTANALPTVATNAPIATTNAPIATTNAPIATPNAPIATTNAPIVTTNAPGVATTNAPIATTNEAADASAVFNLQADSALVPVIAGVALIVIVAVSAALLYRYRKRQRGRSGGDYTYGDSAYTYQGSEVGDTAAVESNVGKAAKVADQSDGSLYYE